MSGWPVKHLTVARYNTLPQGRGVNAATTTLRLGIDHLPLPDPKHSLPRRFLRELEKHGRAVRIRHDSFQARAPAGEAFHSECLPN